MQCLAQNRQIDEFLSIGGSSMSPSRYSRFLIPCFFASCAPNSTIFGELSMAITLRAFFASNCESVPSPAPRSATVSGGRSAIIVCASACQERPGTITAAKPARQLVKIFARFVLTFMQDHLESRAIALCFRHFAGERAGHFSRPSRAAGRASDRSSGRNRRFSLRGDPRRLRRALAGRDDSKCATGPSRARPAIPPRKALPASRRRIRRSRVGSASKRRKFMVDAMECRYDISTYHDWSICRLGTLKRSSVESLQRPINASNPLTFNVLTTHMFVVSFFLPNPSVKVIRIKFATPFRDAVSTLASSRIRKAASPARPLPRANPSLSAAKSRPATAKVSILRSRDRAQAVREIGT